MKEDIDNLFVNYIYLIVLFFKKTDFYNEKFYLMKIIQ
jgi:hypothetical protein